MFEQVSRGEDAGYKGQDTADNKGVGGVVLEDGACEKGTEDAGEAAGALGYT